ncbi:MAG: GNAT family N-acetyltransferase [Alphaproteobacteria bacterium]
MTFRLVPATAADAGLVAALHRRCFDDDEPWRIDGVRGLLAGPGAFALLAYAADTPPPSVPEGGGPAGFGVARVAAGEGEIMAVGVRVEARRQGVGRRLLDALIDHAARAGAGPVFLEVAEGNVTARALYRERGFEIVGRRNAYYRLADGRRADALVMRRRLGANHRSLV